MLFRMTFDVTFVNGQTITVSSRPATDIAFERHFGMSVASLFAEMPTDLVVDGKVADPQAALRWFAGMKSEHSVFLAWHASRATSTFDEWVETVDEVKWNFAKPVDPTQPVQPATSSVLSLP